MCGIAGVWRLDGTAVDEALPQAMAATLRHRGPDEQTSWVRGDVGFGHTRLSIIDLAKSTQPMHSPGGLHLVFNGELFNYRELRKGLDYPWTTDGDTETLLALLERRGIEGLGDIHGQFAFAIYDEKTDQLTLARDAAGVLPVYYCRHGDALAFASEPKALMPLLGTPPSVDPAGLAHYLLFRATRAPATMLQGIHRVPAGHAIRFSRDGTVEEWPWWSLPERELADISDHDAHEELRRRLTRAVEYTQVADVPVGSFLSGGLDSTLVAALAIGDSDPSQLHTFAAGFRGSGSQGDELPFARIASAALGTTHHEVVVAPEAFHGEWQRLTHFRDAPLSEPASVAIAALSRNARGHVRVVLSGEGADELFAGYPKHRYDRYVAALQVLPRGARRRISDALGDRLPARARRLRIAMEAWATDSELDRFATWFAPFTIDEVASAVGADVVREQQTMLAADVLASDGTALRRMLAYDFKTWLPANLLARGDRMTMSASIELRPPFLDRDVIDFAFSLPDRFKIRHGRTKWIIREIAKDLVPPAILTRPKAGFPVPLGAWFRSQSREFLEGYLRDPASLSREVLGGPVVDDLLERHISGRADENARLWTLLSLDIWHACCIRDQAPAAGHV